MDYSTLVSTLALLISAASYVHTRYDMRGMSRAQAHMQAYEHAHHCLNRIDAVARMARIRPLGAAELAKYGIDTIRSEWAVVAGKSTHWGFSAMAVWAIDTHLGRLAVAVPTTHEDWQHRQGREAEAIRTWLTDARDEVNRQWGPASKRRVSRK